MTEWEKIAFDTWRLPVPNGWIYKVINFDGVLSVTFVHNPRGQYKVS